MTDSQIWPDWAQKAIEAAERRGHLKGMNEAAEIARGAKVGALRKYGDISWHPYSEYGEARSESAEAIEARAKAIEAGK